MSSRLDRITDWGKRLREANWQVRALAKRCGIGEWELRNYIRHRFGCRLYDWIMKARMARAEALLREGRPVKDVAYELGYKSAAPFCRAFKRHYGESARACVRRETGATRGGWNHRNRQ